MDRVSVIIPAHDAAPTLRACVMSVMGGTLVPHEVIVVDDASGDETPSLMRELQAEYPETLVYIRSPINRGPAAARNLGTAKASGGFFFFLDADTWLDPSALERFVETIADCDAVCGVYSPDPLNRGAVPRYKATVDHFHFSRAGVIDYDGFSGYCAGVRAEAFRAIGGFDESLAAGQDYENEDFGYRLSEAHRTLINPGIMARHHFPDGATLTRLYFRRVSQWAQLFWKRRRFESAGDATASTGLATLAILGAVIGLAAAPFVGFLPSLAMLALWALGYGRLFVWVLRHKARDLPITVLLAAYFSLVISLGAVWGSLRHFAGLPATGLADVSEPARAVGRDG
jgi:glycosyltransferase involved in cell wall biosynthesis